MDKQTECCFCGKPTTYSINGNDPRPIKIKDNPHAICCNECNAKIVIPTRIEVWGNYTEKNNYLIARLAVSKAIEYMERYMCSDDIPSAAWFIHLASISAHTEEDILKEMKNGK